MNGYTNYLIEGIIASLQPPQGRALAPHHDVLFNDLGYLTQLGQNGMDESVGVITQSLLKPSDAGKQRDRAIPS